MVWRGDFVQIPQKIATLWNRYISALRRFLHRFIGRHHPPQPALPIPMIHRLDGARLKVIRAQEHLESLKAEVGMYLKDDPYVITTEKHLKHVDIRIQPPLRLSTIVGDCVTNARAALDYIIWELAQKFFQPAVDLTDFNDRRILSFPISKDARDQGHRDRLDRLAKRGIPTSAIDEIKGAQPYTSGQNTLLWLHELVNTDKHRMPLLTIAGLGSVSVQSEGSVVHSPEGATGQFTNAMSSRPLSVTITDATTNRITIESTEMEMQTQPSLYIAWKDVAVPREPIDRTLEQIVKTVADVIPRFDGFFT